MVKRKPLFLKIILTLSLLTCITSCKVGRFVYYNFAGITDYKIFESRTAKNDSAVFKFANTDKGKFPKNANVKNKEITFDKFLEDNKTVAFIIIRNDTIQYEKYFKGYDQESVIASFSMAKSVTSILIGCAIDDGFIQSVEEPMVKYIPELTKNGLENVTIKHLLQMTSGIAYNESYVNPFGDAADYYYGTDLLKSIKKRKPKTEPGIQYAYSSGDTQLLGLVLQRALKNISITAYLQQKLWQPLGMEYDATWSLDHENGLEKTFCCINARARDFAKIGRLYLNKGNWNGRQIVSEKWVTESTTPDTTQGGWQGYKYQWWLLTPQGDYSAVGILGQYIYVNPEKNLIIVRMGKGKSGIEWRSMFVNLAQNY